MNNLPQNQSSVKRRGAFGPDGGLSYFPADPGVQGAGAEVSGSGGADAHRSAVAFVKPHSQLVSEAFTEFIRRYDPLWDWYVHLSFRPGRARSGSVHPERADGLFMQFIDRLNKEIFGRNYKRHSDRGVLVARATEIGGIGGLLHYHGLIGRIPERVRRLEWKERWFEISGIGRIFEYDRNLGGAAYLSKSAYAWKRGEIDFIGPWQHAEKIMAESYRVPDLFTVGEAQGVQ